jgi:hypothetical protein
MHLSHDGKSLIYGPGEGKLSPADEEFMVKHEQIHRRFSQIINSCWKSDNKKTTGKITMIDIYNAQAHEFLTDQGAYVHTHVEADFDDGDAENGPGVGGHDAYDLYEGDSHDIIFQRGRIMDLIPIDWDEVRFLGGQPDDFDYDSFGYTIGG